MVTLNCFRGDILYYERKPLILYFGLYIIIKRHKILTANRYESTYNIILKLTKKQLVFQYHQNIRLWNIIEPSNSPKINTMKTYSIRNNKQTKKNWNLRIKALFSETSNYPTKYLFPPNHFQSADKINAQKQATHFEELTSKLFLK